MGLARLVGCSVLLLLLLLLNLLLSLVLAVHLLRLVEADEAPPVVLRKRVVVLRRLAAHLLRQVLRVELAQLADDGRDAPLHGNAQVTNCVLQPFDVLEEQ